MNTKIIKEIAVINSEEVIIKDVQSGIDFIMTVKYETNCNKIALNKEAIVEDFFILSKGLAGEILQKFINYQTKFAIYGDFSKYTSKPLKDFIYESNNGKDIFFVKDKKEAISKLEGGVIMQLIGILIPFLGTVLGSAMVFLMKNKMNKKVEKILLGFASGVMIAASIWSLIMPSIEMTEEQGKIGWVPASIGFLLGIAFLLVLDSLVPHMHLESEKPEGIKSKLKKTTMMIFAVTLHNIPEGMAVGVTFAGALAGNTGITIAGALALAIGIAIQNFPEGAIISMPLKSEGVSKSRAFLYGALSGIVEPIGAIITILLTNMIVPILPYVLSFAAGAMIYVVVEELIPESQAGEHSNIGTIGVALGFTIMMILDVALG